MALLCELHAHTRWSDGDLAVAELVDLYGTNGFDVLCVTDHAVRGTGTGLVDRGNHADYLADVEREAARARRAYRMVVIPAVELTWDEGCDGSAHAVAIGLRSFAALDGGIEPAMQTARDAGAAIVAAHPHGERDDPNPNRTTRRFWRRFDDLAPLVHRWELINRHQVFPWIAERRLPAVASGDFHRLEHLAGWKTLLPCARDEETIVAFLRGDGPAYLRPFG
jgi:hypothetical protein